MTRLSSHHMRPSTISARTVTLQVRLMDLQTMPSPLPHVHVLHCTLPFSCKHMMCVACLWCSAYCQNVQCAQRCQYTGIRHSNGPCTVLQICRLAQLAVSTLRASQCVYKSMMLTVCCCGVQTGLCRHTYQSPHLHGLAGSFTQGQLMRLQECLPEGCVDYVEEDVKVILPCHLHCHLSGISNFVSSHVVRRCQEHACNPMRRLMQLASMREVGGGPSTSRMLHAAVHGICFSEHCAVPTHDPI